MLFDAQQEENPDDDPERTKMRRSLRLPAWGIGGGAAILIIMARENVGPPYLDSLGKAFFWTGTVFLPLLGLNRDICRLNTARLTAVALFGLHLILVSWLFGQLKDMSFITLFPLCIVQLLVFEIPFVIIRKRTQLP
jgi:hypothetical protein